MSEAKDLIVQGLWKNNSALVQLLGMCPLLAVTSTVTNALGLGLATTLVLTLTNGSISAVRRWVPNEVRIPIYVMIIAAAVSIVQMLINAYAFGLYQSLGIFIPLIVTNCIVVGRAEAVASKKPIGLSALDGLAIGLGATGVMVTLGAMRELLGNGTCSTAPICCWAAGPKYCASKWFTLTARSCWPCCHRGPLSAWDCCWR